MARKFGKANEVKIDPLKYNIGLLGESGAGKTCLIKEMLESKVGEDGYIFFEIGKEDGEEAINGIIAEKVETWDELEEIRDDIIENRTTDYKDLKVVVFDTYDQLVTLAEQQSIDLYNRENTEKRCTSINSAWGGFQKGQDKAIELMLDMLWSFKKAGINYIIIGHVKNKDLTDVATGGTYQVLTSDLPQKYFNAIKTKLHFLGLLYIDREIVKEKTGKKDFVTKKDLYKDTVKSEVRKIKFRDDNYALDSKSRFADIEPEIEFSPELFYNAMLEAIKKEASKSSKSFEQLEKEQSKKEAEDMKAYAEKEKKLANDKLLKAKIKIVMEYLKDNKEDKEKIMPILSKCKELGYAKPTEIEALEDIELLETMCE